MKILAIASNYADTSRQTVFGESDGPLWFEIPDSSIVRTGQPLFIPDFAPSFRIIPSAVFRISRLGKGIAPRFAARYADSATMGAILVADTLLASLLAKGHPWAPAVAFDKSCALGNFIPLQSFLSIGDWSVSSGPASLVYSLRDIHAGFEQAVSLLSRDITLKEGDLIAAALHPCGLKAEIGRRLHIIEKSDNQQPLSILDISLK